MTVEVQDDDLYLTDPSSYVTKMLERERVREHVLAGQVFPGGDARFPISCLLAFVQANWTGPTLPEDFPDWDREIHLRRLMQDGEPPYALVRFPWLLSTARDWLAREEDSQWWYLRSLHLQGQLLDAHSSSLVRMVKNLVEAQLEQAYKHWGPIAYVEASLLLQLVGEEERSQKLLEMASETGGFKFSFTGALGRRTRLQTFDIAQLTVQVVSDQDVSGSESPNGATARPVSVPLQDENIVETPILAASEFNYEKVCTSDTGKLVLLGNLSHMLRFHAKDTAVREKATALVEKILERPGDWGIYSTALYIRSRLEAKTSRYVERAALQFQALVEQIHAHAKESPFASRIQHFFYVPYPSEWELDCQQGRLFAGLGAFQSAAAIFKRRAMWDEYVACLMQLGEHQQAEAVILDQLEQQPTNPKMLCVLGDLRKDISLYERAWEVSEGKFARAMRSLGMHHVQMGANEKAIHCFEQALKLNSLFDRIWFLLGCTAMQVEDWAKALSAFSRTIALYDDNADAWNNLAAVHLQLGHPEQALRALKEAGKRQFDNWKIWSNIFRVALSLGDLSEAISAYRRVAEIREKETPLDGLEIILTSLDELIRRLGPTEPHIGVAIRQMNGLLDTVMASHLSMSRDFWYLCARYATIIGQPEEAIEFGFKAYRALPVVGWENDPELVNTVLGCLLKIRDSIAQAEAVQSSGCVDLSERKRQLKLLAEGLYDRASKNRQLSLELTSALTQLI